MGKSVKKQFVDDDGINRLSIVPSEYENAEIGVPVDVFHILDSFYGDKAPATLRQRLYKMLWDVGLREPSDFLAHDVGDRYKQALRHAIASDSTDAIRYILDTIPK